MISKEYKNFCKYVTLVTYNFVNGLNHYYKILCNIPSTDEVPFAYDDVNRKTNCYIWTQEIPHHIVRTDFQGLFDKRGAQN